jgi:hypothetical protein
MGRIKAASGQGTVEWTGLLLLLSVVMTVLAHLIGVVPGERVFHSVQRSVLCAVSLSEDCLDEGSLEGAYGPEIASLVRENTPEILFGPGRLGLPVDFRSCRSPGCADGPEEGIVGESGAGEAVTLFTRAIDRRETGGGLYIQYWAYYPESASLRGVPVLEEKGYHRHDWESVQVRIGSDGEVTQRASSHAGYNHTRSGANWGSDIGSGILRDVAEAAGLRNKGGWGEATGRWLVAGGSHAGNVDGETGPGDYPAWAPAYRIRLIPLEQVRGGPLARPADFTPITPPWRKSVWTDPESEGTG